MLGSDLSNLCFACGDQTGMGRWAGIFSIRVCMVCMHCMVLWYGGRGGQQDSCGQILELPDIKRSYSKIWTSSQSMRLDAKHLI